MHGRIQRRPQQVSQFRAAYSVCSTEPQIAGALCALLQRSPRPRIPGESFCAATIWRRSATPHQPRGPFRPAWARDQRLVQSTIWKNGVAFPDLIMDDKSMQSWSSMELTLVPVAGTIFGMDKPTGRPRKPLTPTAYEEAFRRRVRNARALRTDEPKEMARLLGVREDTYYRYETRTMLPHYMIERFCQLTGVTVDWLIKGPQPGQPSHTGVIVQE